MPRIRYIFPLFVLALLISTAYGCVRGELLTDVSASTKVISPNGKGVNDVANIAYSLQRDAKITIYFVDDLGKQYPFRTDESRSAGSYTAAFRGVYLPWDGKPDKRVMPDGHYTFVVAAVDQNGNRSEQKGDLTIEQADTNAPTIQDVVIQPSTISPDGDAVNDEANISYGLSKESTVTLFVTDNVGNRFLLEPPTKKSAALFSHTWNGTSNGSLLADGNYMLHVQATDDAGNVTESTEPVTITGGGTPKLEIEEVKFTPLSVPVGGTINVRVKVKNTGDTTLKTMGPAHGTPYTTDMSFNYWTEEIDGQKQPKYFETPGKWRIGIMWSLAPSSYPIRWGLTDQLQDLKPGEEATITGTIKVLIPRTREVYFWASVVQEGVGFPGGQVGQQKIIISY